MSDIKFKKTALYLMIILLFAGHIANVEEKYRSISLNISFAEIVSNRLYFVPMIAPIVFYFCLLTLRKKIKRDQSSKKILMQKYPPEGITPAVANYLYFNKTNPYIFLSTIIDMAIKGVINLELVNKKDSLVITRGENKDGGEFYNEYAELMINYINNQNKINLSERKTEPEEKIADKNTIITKNALIQKLKKNIKQSSGVFYRQLGEEEKVPVYLMVYLPIVIFIIMIGVFLVAIALIMFGLMENPFLGLFNNEAIVMLSATFFLIVSISVAFINILHNIKNSAGIEKYRQILGFDQYLSSKEKINSEEATEERFEKYLPYAMALGEEYFWAKRFRGVNITVPKWLTIRDENGNIFSNFNTEQLTDKISSVIDSNFYFEKYDYISSV